MIIMGVDPGIRMTGFGVLSVRGSRIECLDYGTIPGSRGAKGPSIHESLKRIYSKLESLLLQHRPDIVAVEGLFHAVNARTALILGQARGVILLAAAQQGARVKEYSPLEVKKAVAGYGRADKTQVQFMVRTLLNLKKKPEPHDASDALAIALCQAFTGSSLRGVARTRS